MIKDVLVPLAVAAPKDAAADYAVSLGASFGAHVVGVAFAYDPVMPPTMMGGIPADFIEAQRREAETQAKAAASAFDGLVTRAGISGEARVLEETMAGAAELTGRIARRYDISVVRQAEPERFGPDEVIAESVLFESGRPMLMVPYVHTGPALFERIMVCWDASRQAARAIGDAMPFLHRAKAIEVVTIASERAKSDEIPAADIAHHLARHRLPVDLKRVMTSGTDVGSTILSHAADSGAQLIVMGGYGHSRLREFVLGGVTRSMFRSMTVPVLMAH